MKLVIEFILRGGGVKLMDTCLPFSVKIAAPNFRNGKANVPPAKNGTP